MKKTLALFIFTLVTCMSNAAVVSTGKISLADKQLHLIADPYVARVYIMGAEMAQDTLGCEHSTPVILLGDKNPQGELLYNTLLSAKKAGQSISLEAKGCWDAYSVPVVFSVKTY